MKCSIPEISWHNREPVLSIDFQPINVINNDFYRFATAGSDTLVLIWKLIILPDGQVDIKVLSELRRHQKSVNVVKWSPNGDFLASGDDDANIILWQLKADNIPSLDEKEDEFEEKWHAFKVLRGHKDDVYDLCWSPRSDKLVSGSVDNTVILWDALKMKSEHIIKDHKGFVQGVAWDPKSDYFATLCSDRICRVFDSNGRRVKARIGRGKLPVNENNEFYEKEVKYFHDDTFKSYFRRLDFSADGSLLLVPSVAVETDEKKNALFGTFAFSLDALNDPVFIFPSGKQCSIAVKSCPKLFTLRENGPNALIDLPYRMIIAVATDSDVILYDTQQLAPCIHLQNIHYTRLTDLAWSIDGLLLAASSTDGFVTLVTFQEGELGTPYNKEESDLEDSVLNISGLEVLHAEESEKSIIASDETEIPLEKPKKPSFLQKWAKQGTKRKSEEISEEKGSKQDKIDASSSTNFVSNDIIEIDDDEPEKELLEVEIKKKRITPILISKEVTRKLKNVKPEVEDKIEDKPKRRVQLIKIGEVDKKRKNNDIISRSEKDENLTDTPAVRKEQLTHSQDVVILNKDVEEAVSTSTLLHLQKENTKNVKGMSIDKITTPSSNSKRTPKEKQPQIDKSTSEKSSTKKKKQIVQPSNTLFNYMKPISKTLDSKSADGADTPKKEFKPQKLFGEDSIEREMEHGKIKTTCLFKPKIASVDLVSMCSEETATELPEDFVLRVDEDVIIVNDTSDAIEKENGPVESKQIALKTMNTDIATNNLKNDIVMKKGKRRVPLITLSSPKNKKKPKTVESTSS